MFALPASPIGLSEKVGMRERDWNRKGRARERERKPEREFLWLGTLHRKRRGLSCVYSVRQRETSSRRGVQASDLLLFNFVFRSLRHLNSFCRNQVNNKRDKSKLLFISSCNHTVVIMSCAVLMFSAHVKLFDERYLMAGGQTLSCQLSTLGPHYAVTAGGDWCCGNCSFVAITEREKKKGSSFHTHGPMNLSARAT